MEQKKKWWPTIWTSTTIRVDIDTGEQISKHKLESKQYIKIITRKKINYNADRTKGHIEHTIECRKQPQIRIWE